MSLETVAARGVRRSDKVAVGDVPCINREHPAVGRPAEFVDAAGSLGVFVQFEPSALVGHEVATGTATFAFALADCGAPLHIPTAKRIQEKSAQHAAPQSRPYAERPGRTGDR